MTNSRGSAARPDALGIATALLITENGIAARIASAFVMPSALTNRIVITASVAANPSNAEVAETAISRRRSRVTVRSSAPSSTIRMSPSVPSTGTTGAIHVSSTPTGSRRWRSAIPLAISSTTAGSR